MMQCASNQQGCRSKCLYELEFKVKATKTLLRIPLPTMYLCKFSQKPPIGFTDLEKAWFYTVVLLW